MQAIRSVDPELDLRGSEQVTSPERGTCYLFPFVGLSKGTHLCLQNTSVPQGAALGGNSCSDLAPAGPAMEIGVSDLSRQLRHGAFNSYLAAEGFPMEAERGAWVPTHLVAFLAVCISVEAEPAIFNRLHKDHAYAWEAIRGCGSQCRCRRIVRLRDFCVRQPRLKEDQGVIPDELRSDCHPLMLVQSHGIESVALLASCAIPTSVPESFLPIQIGIG